MKVRSLWLPRSPNLSSLDFLLVGRIKGHVVAMGEQHRDAVSWQMPHILRVNSDNGIVSGTPFNAAVMRTYGLNLRTSREEMRRNVCYCV
jgi:hypothetical protein